MCLILMLANKWSLVTTGHFDKCFILIYINIFTQYFIRLPLALITNMCYGSIHFCDVTRFLCVSSCVNFSPRSSRERQGRTKTHGWRNLVISYIQVISRLHSLGIGCSSRRWCSRRSSSGARSLWKRVNPDSSDHTTFFHCSRVQF